MSKNLKYTLYILGGVTLIYLAFVYKRANIDTGYGSKDIEKEILVNQAMALMGVEDTPKNRMKYTQMSIEQLKKLLLQTTPVGMQ